MSKIIRDAEDFDGDLESDYRAGYGAPRLELLRRRTFESHGAFLLPYLRAWHTVLDCGCGPGVISIGLAGRVPQGSLTCIDLSERQLEESRLRARQAGAGNISFFRQDAGALGFATATFDVVFANALVEHLRAPAPALREMWRVLRPGGILALRSPNWTALRLSPASDAGSMCVELFASRLRCRRALADGGEVARLLEGLHPAAVGRSESDEAHQPAGLFAEAIITSLPAAGPDTLPPTIDAFRAWSRDPSSIAVEKWDEIILMKEKYL
jgi:SAM-dependent methyltransferase